MELQRLTQRGTAQYLCVVRVIHGSSIQAIRESRAIRGNRNILIMGSCVEQWGNEKIDVFSQHAKASAHFLPQCGLMSSGTLTHCLRHSHDF